MFTVLSEQQCFNGRQIRFEHASSVCHCTMTASVYLPPQAQTQQCPVVYWLSGLTCTDENAVQKAGFQRAAAELGLIVVTPDTSPRGDDVPDDPDGAWDFGLGAGFYVNATQSPWSTHYHMYDYVVHELPALIEANFPANQQRSISGHSMGGHGALTIALRHPDRYCSVSAFAPIVSPIHCAWGQKALSHYLGDDKALWQQHDTCELVKQFSGDRAALPLLVEQGGADQFLTEQLQPQQLMQVCEQFQHPLDYRLREDYDHSYFFVASFIEAHLCFHHRALLS